MSEDARLLIKYPTAYLLNEEQEEARPEVNAYGESNVTGLSAWRLCFAV